LTELHRQQALFDSKAATHQQLETATAQQGQLSGMVDARKADLARAEGALAASQSQLEAAKRQREALNTKDDVYKADIEAKKAAIVVAQVNLAYTRIAAPTDGTVGERRALAGQLVAPGTQVISLVQSEVWVQANFKETQLTNMRVGDTADVRIDTFPIECFTAKSSSSLPPAALSSPFAAGQCDWQLHQGRSARAVKIVFFPGQPYLDRLRPGFSAVVTVHTGKGWRTIGR
jgi:membrane fusion protein (multidrug efflux system)